MRTTLTLDDDVAAQLEQLRGRDGRPFKQLVNDVMRAGLAHLDREMQAARRRGAFTRAVSLGRPLMAHLDDVSGTLAIAEGDDYR